MASPEKSSSPRCVPTNDSQDAAGQRGRIASTSISSRSRQCPRRKDGPLRTPRRPSGYLKKALSRRLTSLSRKPRSRWTCHNDRFQPAPQGDQLSNRSAAHFIRQVLLPGDRLSVFAFRRCKTAAGFSDNGPELQLPVRKMPGRWPGTRLRRRTPRFERPWNAVETTAAASSSSLPTPAKPPVPPTSTRPQGSRPPKSLLTPSYIRP